MFVLCAFPLRHIDDCTDDLEKFSVCGVLGVTRQFDIFDCPSGKYDSKLDLVVRLLARSSSGYVIKPFAVVRMHALQDRFGARETVKPIKTQNSKSFI
jgi:hypothetical protein